MSAIAKKSEFGELKRYKPYPTYKDSGVEWLGEVPEHWDIRKLKYISMIRLSNIDKKKIDGEKLVFLCNYTDVYYHDYISSNMKFMEATATNDEICGFKLQKGDVLITKDSEAWNDIGVPAYVNEDFNNVLCGYHLAQIKPTFAVVDGNYLLYAFQSYGIKDQFHIAANGITRYGLSKDDIACCLITIPSIDEQKKMSKFLRRELGKIDALIAKQERLIELLHEKRSALITRAVTKGLDPDAPMKDSGVGWLEEIPMNWKTVKLKFLILHPLQYGLNEPSVSDDVGCPRYIRITDFDENGVLRNDTLRTLPLSQAKNYLLNNGDVLFARSGATVGKTFQFKNYNGTACFAGYLIRATPKTNKLSSDFLYYFTKSQAYERWINSVFVQATIENVSADKYKELIIPLPSIEEQFKIVKIINNELKVLDRTVGEAGKLIAFLKEYRTALISAAVTGKIDVRGEVS